jgi:hypothetical protein
MNRTKAQKPLATFSVAILVGAITMLAAQAGYGQTLPAIPVVVRNPGSQPVPVTGSVTIGNTTAIPVTGSVSLNGTSNVNVANAISLVPGSSIALSSSASNPVFVQDAQSSRSTTLLLAAPSLVINGTADLGTIDVSAYRQIRVSVIDDNGPFTAVPEHVFVTFSFVESGQEFAGLQPLDVSSSYINSHLPNTVSEIYDFPGKTLHIRAVCGSGLCAGRFSLVIYGR